MHLFHILFLRLYLYLQFNTKSHNIYVNKLSTLLNILKLMRRVLDHQSFKLIFYNHIYTLGFKIITDEPSYSSRRDNGKWQYYFPNTHSSIIWLDEYPDISHLCNRNHKRSLTQRQTTVFPK